MNDAILACAHFVWLVRSDFGEALLYSTILVWLLSSRLIFKYRQVIEGAAIAMFFLSIVEANGVFCLAYVVGLVESFHDSPPISSSQSSMKSLPQ